MSLVERGRTGALVALTADGVTGVVTQNPEGMLHSIDGLTSTDGNTAYGQSFKLVAFFGDTGELDTTVTFFSSNSPFKFRVLGAKARVIQNAEGGLEASQAYVNVTIRSTDGVVATTTLDGMEDATEKYLSVSSVGNAVVDSDESLNVRLWGRVPDMDGSTTCDVIVEVECLRIV